MHVRDVQLLTSMMDATCMSFEPASFDRIFCVEAIFYFQRKEDFLAGVARILKPGGALVFSDALCRRG